MPVVVKAYVSAIIISCISSLLMTSNVCQKHQCHQWVTEEIPMEYNQVFQRNLKQFGLK
ncbi:MAG: hypothetical protein KME64_41325 [Scytonematopsis contorta HA4267-MV1]|nr:hypothetical protein [Scytonematopsis contorta HA4267-MV1]